jgi:hypothetical protein
MQFFGRLGVFWFQSLFTDGAQDEEQFREKSHKVLQTSEYPAFKFHQNESMKNNQFLHGFV